SKLRYAVNLEGKSADEQIKVYPTNCNDKLFVDFDNEGSSYDYAITDMKGNKVQKGKFIERYNVVDIHNLVPDNYIIFIEKTDGKYTVKFTKN
ncbi:MAG TPA: T9SS type A sorting domain-containing protein, partial [Chitinophagaceae bacterium]|nr:T9SS type A sorting domain-containing protein [Chitinophagaceae bacterium]